MSDKQYNKAYLLPGREWGVTLDGENLTPTEVTETYEVLFAEPVARGALFTSVSGLPAIGSKHPAFPNLYAAYTGLPIGIVVEPYDKVGYFFLCHLLSYMTAHPDDIGFYARACRHTLAVGIDEVCSAF